MMKVQRAIDDLRQQLAPHLKTGQFTLNLREGRLESFETRTYARLRAEPQFPLDKLTTPSAS